MEFFTFRICSLIAVLSISSVSCNLQECLSTPLKSEGCSYMEISSVSSWCTAGSFTNSSFIFYVKPKKDFKELKVKMTKVVPNNNDDADPSQANTTSSYWVLGEESDSVGFGRTSTFPKDKWYEVEVRPTDQAQRRPMIFSLYVDGVLKATKRPSFTAPSHFSVMISGSLFYSHQCNPLPKRKLQPHLESLSVPLGNDGLSDSNSTTSADASWIPQLDPSNKHPNSSFNRARLGSLSVHEGTQDTSDSSSSRLNWLSTATATVGSMIFVAFVIMIFILNKRYQERGRLFDEEDDDDVNTCNRDGTLHM